MFDELTDRSTIEEVVLEQIYQLAGVKPPERREENGFAGYPLTATPKHAAWIFYALWPLATVLAWWIVRRGA